MKTPSLWMIAAASFGPGRARAICHYKDVKHAATVRDRAKHTWPAIGRFVIGGALGAACDPAFGLRSRTLPTKFALRAIVLGFVASLQPT